MTVISGTAEYAASKSRNRVIIAPFGKRRGGRKPVITSEGLHRPPRGLSANRMLQNVPEV